MKKASLVLAGLMLLLAGCSNGSVSKASAGFEVVTTVSPITDIARNVAGNVVHIDGLIPDGVDSHTFEQTLNTARLIMKADVILLNDLHLYDLTLRQDESKHSKV